MGADTRLIELDCRGEKLHLLPDKAIFRPLNKTLLVADPHFGKAATFRHAGIPIPHGTTATDLGRLTQAIATTKAERLVVLGDFFHAPEGRAVETMDAIGRWRQEHRSLAVTIVVGNHDRRAGGPPDDWGVEWVADPLADPPFLYSHEPHKHRGLFVLAGHLHPSITMHDVAGPSLRAPCFWFSVHAAVLPAFGSFTGTHRVNAGPRDRLFAVGPGAVIEIPHSPTRRRAIRRPPTQRESTP